MGREVRAWILKTSLRMRLEMTSALIVFAGTIVTSRSVKLCQTS